MAKNTDGTAQRAGRIHKMQPRQRLRLKKSNVMEAGPCVSDEPVDPKRSCLMSRVKAQNTKPERIVRQLLHSLGYRFRLHTAELPGSPDITLPKYRSVIFVHGCFWHRHANCSRATTPRTRVEFWTAKFERNKIRDRKALRLLRKLGWHPITVWECQIKTLEKLSARLETILKRRGKT